MKNDLNYAVALIRINPQDGGISKHHFLGLDMTALEALKAIDVLLNFDCCRCRHECGFRFTGF